MHKYARKRNIITSLINVKSYFNDITKFIATLVSLLLLAGIATVFVIIFGYNLYLFIIIINILFIIMFKYN